MRIWASWLVVLLLATSQCRAAANALEGVWLFEKEVNTRADGSIVKVPSPGYDGVLIYTADGYVSATVMPKDRKWSVDSATFQDLMASVGEGASTAYAGRYFVDPVSRKVTHIPAASLDPGDKAKSLVRNYSIAGDKLLLSGKWKYQGEELTFTVHWIRAGTRVKN